ncbi:lytic polysaccharide monooxygenase [Amniculicola lignicola CBS 123094]|uniref:Lytic polysaccharide monooxygenase n=1 Tax=Amniculicola lignicola CBS 123094 TaxID=1392246 RepID=A0A6A5WSA2_9PLEO|nr:lytic polysaccharide monooxygenase [Amniculicola lignicola CBS 123094]
MSFRSALVAATALLATTQAHIIMSDPVPYSKDKIDSGPISRPQFPCKSQNGFTVTTQNTMAAGSKQQIITVGEAVHNGGSCQVSISKDVGDKLTPNSVFKVIQSVEGACPGLDGKTTPLDYTLPASVPEGEVTLAWTWFPVSSGGPEMYMNCAPITVSGGTGDGFDALPDMFVGNLDGASGCRQVPDTILEFPNPGSAVSGFVSQNRKKAAPVNCGASDSPPAEGASSVAGGAPSATPSAAPSAAPSARTGSPSTPTTPPTTGGTGTCTENGAVVCNGPTQFGLCNNGQVVWQAVAAGTTCENGAVQKRGYTGRFARPRAVIPGKDFTPSI